MTYEIQTSNPGHTLFPTIKQAKERMDDIFVRNPTPEQKFAQKLYMCEFCLRRTTWPTHVHLEGKDYNLKILALHSFMNAGASYRAGKIEEFFHHGQDFTDCFGLAVTHNIIGLAKRNRFETDFFVHREDSSTIEPFIVFTDHLDWNWECLSINDYDQQLPKPCYESFRFVSENHLPLTDFRIALPKPKPAIPKRVYRDPYFIAKFDAGYFTRFRVPKLWWVYLFWWE